MRWVYLLYSAAFVAAEMGCAFLDVKQQYCCFTPVRRMAQHGATERGAHESMMSHCH